MLQKFDSGAFGGNMKNNRIVMPHGFTMLARGITRIEGVLADIAPGINVGWDCFCKE